MRIEAAPLDGQRDGEIAINLRAATPTETFDLFCRVYALSPRERDVVALLIAGLDTRAITQRLFISAHTVQDHLKSVFAKTGLHSRRALLARFGTADRHAERALCVDEDVVPQARLEMTLHLR